MSLPSSSAESPAAIAAAEPPDEPPGVRAGSHGLFVVPKIGLWVCMSAVQVGVLVLPKTTAPAARSRATLMASSFGHVLRQLGDTARGPQARRLEALLHGDRQAVERAECLSRGEGAVGGVRGRARPLDVERHHGVDTRVPALDACKEVLEQLAAPDLAPAQGGHELRGAPEREGRHAVLQNF